MKNLIIEYLVDSKTNFKIIDPIDGNVTALIINYKNIKNISSRPEFSSENSLYFLVSDCVPKVNLEFLLNCKDEVLLNTVYNNDYKNTLSQIYIGKTTHPIKRGFQKHHSGPFDYAILFISKLKTGFSLNQIEYMEHHYYRKYNNSIHNNIKNKTTPSCPSLSTIEKKSTNNYIENIDILLSVIDSTIFPLDFKLFSITSKGVTAHAYIINDNFTIVTKNSQAVKEETLNSKHNKKPLVAKRQNLINKGILIPNGSHYVFSQDYIFASKSGAAECILGNSRSGSAWSECKF